MANAQLLELRRKESGKTKKFLAEKMRVSRPRLYSIFKNPETATVFQGDILVFELNLNDDDRTDIFLP